MPNSVLYTSYIQFVYVSHIELYVIHGQCLINGSCYHGAMIQSTAKCILSTRDIIKATYIQQGGVQRARTLDPYPEPPSTSCVVLASLSSS